jgi:hypothetical protein
MEPPEKWRRHRCGIFDTSLVKSRNAFAKLPPRSKKSENSELCLYERWLSSCLPFSRSHVFRPVLFSIALSLAAGPNASLLCKALCEPPAAAATGCHEGAAQSDSAASVVGDHHCDANIAVVTVVLKKDVRRTAPEPHGDFAHPLERYRLDATVNAARVEHGPGQPPSLDTRPLETTLRI